MPRYFNPYASPVDLVGLGDALGPLREILAKRRAALAKLPPPATPVGLGQIQFNLQTSEGEIRQAVAACAPAVGGFENGSASQLQCWLDVARSQVGQLAQAYDQIRAQVAAQAQGIVPQGAGVGTDQAATFAGLRQAQLAYIATAQKFLGALGKVLTDPNRGWVVLLAAGQKGVSDARALESQITAKEIEVGSSSALDQIKADVAKTNLEVLGKAYLPFVDMSLAELKVARDVLAMTTQGLAASADEAQRRTVGLSDSLNGFITYLDTQIDQGIFGDIADFFRGATHQIARLILGGAVVVGIAVGIGALARWVWHKSGQSGSGVPRATARKRR